MEIIPTINWHYAIAVNTQIQSMIFTAFSLGLRVGLYVFFPLWGIQLLLNIIEKEAK